MVTDTKEVEGAYLHVSGDLRRADVDLNVACFIITCYKGTSISN